MKEDKITINIMCSMEVSTALYLLAKINRTVEGQ